MPWWERRRTAPQSGSVLFRGAIPPRLENFAFLHARGMELIDAPTPARAHWQGRLRHPTWGEAELTCLRDAPMPPPVLLEWDPRLTHADRESARATRTAVTISLPPRTGNVLADRKDLLRLLGAVMADDGVLAVDHDSQVFWTRAGLDDELAHDAELDVEALYTVHSIREDGAPEGQPYWLHSHGLGALGFWDFDMLSPHPDIASRGADLLRAVAYAIVEGVLTPGGASRALADRMEVRAVAARDVLAALPREEFTHYRGEVDDFHLDGHAVLCDPAASGLLAKLLGRARPTPARCLQREVGEEPLIFYSRAATALMANRARQTLPYLRRLVEELSALELPVLLKLGYPIPGAADDEREHLWFAAHALGDETADATLTNQPYYVPSLRKGQRAHFSLELLSDWQIVSPFGAISPRPSRALHVLRAERPAIEAWLASRPSP